VLPTIAHGLRVQRAPGIPHALYSLGERFLHNSGKSCREIAGAYFHVIASEAKQSILFLRGAMDCFAALAMTVLAV
jgi:hypothetical protein